VEKNQSIEALRGVSITLVFLQHVDNLMPTPTWYSSIWQYVTFSYAVDIFLVISGFLVSASLDHIVHIGRQSGVGSGRILFAFLIRRATRLWPAAWLWLAIGAPIFFVFYSNSPEMRNGLLWSTVSAATNVSNFYWAWCVAHNQIAATCPSADINSVYWSLSLEEQFYLVLAVGVLSFKALPLRALAILLIAIQFFLHRPGFGLAWMLRTDALLYGYLIFAASRHPRFLRLLDVIRERSITVPIVVSLAIVVIAPLLMIRGGIGLASLASATLLIVALSDPRGERFPFVAPLSWIGERSYSIYLCHFPIMATTVGSLSFVLDGEISVFFIIAGLASFAFSCLAATATLCWIERPIQRAGKAWSQKLVERPSEWVPPRLTPYRSTHGLATVDLKDDNSGCPR
jgi:peptidoglycan/LPS O-acetylase OafA/YrhL